MQETDLSNYWGNEHLEAGSPLATAMEAAFGQTTTDAERAEKLRRHQDGTPKYTFLVVTHKHFPRFLFDEAQFEYAISMIGEKYCRTFVCFEKALLHYLKWFRQGNLTEEALRIKKEYQRIIDNERDLIASIPML
ncbi:MAG: hypothetical protein JNL72_15115 [Flavipsychrobacter sp.]|nr:hypothetical protein [Flavipsychrobacter sp.]